MIVTPEIKACDVRGIALASWAPPNPHDFSFQVTLSIGPSNSAGAEYFYCDVCSVDWLSNKVEEDTSFFVSRMLVLASFDHKIIERNLKERVQRVSADNWPEVVEKLQALFQWEFEGYNAQDG
jgi:hypothetical protein